LTARFGLTPKSGQLIPKSAVILLRNHWSINSEMGGQISPKYAVRAYGIFAPSNRHLLNDARTQRGQLPVHTEEEATWQDICAQAGPHHPELCPVCGKQLIVTELLTPHSRPPCNREAGQTGLSPPCQNVA
jgi:hypothetical protein